MSAYREPASVAHVAYVQHVPEFYAFKGNVQDCPGCGMPTGQYGAIHTGVYREWKPRRWFRRVAHYSWRCECGFRWRELPKGRES